MAKNFIASVLAGTSQALDIDAWVGEWYQGKAGPGVTLAMHLGLTDIEYAVFVKNPHYINTVIEELASNGPRRTKHGEFGDTNE